MESLRFYDSPRFADPHHARAEARALNLTTLYRCWQNEGPGFSRGTEASTCQVE
jgi:hypothetical protein